MKSDITVIRVFIFILVYFHIGFLLGQNEMFRDFTINDGLPENTANALLQDSQGQIWIGTQAGVAIYDGARFKTIGTEGEDDFRLSNNMVESLYEDSNGFIYIGTRNGMNIYNPINQKSKLLFPIHRLRLEIIFAEGVFMRIQFRFGLLQGTHFLRLIKKISI